ncbi:MAG: 5-carboxymethyl-2-hydroxymuconate isomerase [Francisellaceae bacterium]|jgi:5-carboxymethyl-2-hydroxymuconate isomerase
MPHFIIHSSKDISETYTAQEINKEISRIAESTMLFDLLDIKVRVDFYDQYLVGNEEKSFIHVFAHIMEGRSELQRANLSKSIVTRLSIMFPSVDNIAMNVYEFEKNTYCNLKTLASK